MKNWVDLGFIAELFWSDVNIPGAQDLFWDNYDGIMEWAQHDMNLAGDGRMDDFAEFDSFYRQRCINEVLVPLDLINQTYAPFPLTKIHRYPNPWLSWLNERLKHNSPSIPYFFYGGYNETNKESENNYLLDSKKFKLITGSIYNKGYVNDVLVPVTSAFLDITKHDEFIPQGERNENLFEEVYPGSDHKSALYVPELIIPATKFIYPCDNVSANCSIRFFKDYNHRRIRDDAKASEFKDENVWSWYRNACPLQQEGIQVTYPLFGTIEYDLNYIFDSIHPFPTNVQISLTNDGAVTLSWDDPQTDNSVRTAGYRIYYGTSSGKLTLVDDLALLDDNDDNVIKTLYTFENLTCGLKYYFAVSAYDAEGTESVLSEEVSAIPVDTTPTGNISGFQATADKYSANLSWTNPSDIDFENVLIVRSTSSINWAPIDGNYYYGTISDNLYVIYNFHGASCPDSNLLPDTTYYYKAFAYDEQLNYSSGVSVSITTEKAVEPTATSVGNFRGTTTASSINLYWDPPQDTDYQNYLVVRGSWGPMNNTEYNIGENGIIYKGTNTSCSENSLNMRMDYQYNIYAYHKYSVYDEANNVWNTYVDYCNEVSVNLRTKLGGTLSTDITLSKDKNPHIVTSMLTIPEGITLTITPGTIINFQGSHPE